MWEERHQDKCEDVSEEEGKGGAEDLTDAEAGDDDADIDDDDEDMSDQDDDQNVDSDAENYDTDDEG